MLAMMVVALVAGCGARVAGGALAAAAVVTRSGRGSGPQRHRGSALLIAHQSRQMPEPLLGRELSCALR
eukprot:1511361-Alexandrium_andersonii.AAC.1